MPNFKLKFQNLFSLNLEEKLIKDYCQTFEVKSIGRLIETIIYSMMKLSENNENNKTFILNNNKKRKLIGEYSKEENFCYKTYRLNKFGMLESRDQEYDTLKYSDQEDKLLIKKINKLTLKIKNRILPLIKFIKEKIFKSQQIYSQELIIKNELKSFGFTDLSNENICLEIKFSNENLDSVKKIESFINRIKYQLYILSNNRPMFLLLIANSKFRIFNINFS